MIRASKLRIALDRLGAPNIAIDFVIAALNLNESDYCNANGIAGISWGDDEE